jgi:hypothetical protein
MSIEAEVLLEQARKLPAEERRALAQELLRERPSQLKSIHDLRTFKPLPDVPPMSDHNEGVAEAIMFFKGMKDARKE